MACSKKKVIQLHRRMRTSIMSFRERKTDRQRDSECTILKARMFFE